MSDLVPALRWSRPQQVAEVLGDARLPGGWWASVELSRALGTTGVDWLCDRLARLVVGRWDHLPLTDVLPALQVHSVDPALPGWPEPGRSVVIGLGGWHRLRRLTAGDLRTPTAPASPEAVLTIVFREVLKHLQAEQPVAAPPVSQSEPLATPRLTPLPPGAQPTAAAPTGPHPAVSAPPTGPHPAISAPPTGPHPAISTPLTGPQPAAAALTGPPVASPQPPAGQPTTAPAAVPPLTASPAPAALTGIPAGTPQPSGSEPTAPPLAAGAAAPPLAGTQPPVPQPVASLAPPQPPVALPPAPPAAGPSAGAPAAASPLAGTQPPAAQPTVPPGPAPLPVRASSHAASPRRSPLDPLGTVAPEPRTDAPLAAPVPNEHPMVGVVDGMFRDWDPLARAVAVQRLFAAEPVSLRALAHALNVDRELLSQAQRSAEERVLMWLRSPDSAALTGHLFGLTEWLGTAATQEQLIGADPSHPIEVPALGTELWRVLVTLMPDRRLQDGWLVVGDLGGLREKTRQLLATRTADTDVVELLGQLGIRSHSAKAWLDSMPQDQRPEVSTSAPNNGSPPPGNDTAPLPRRTPGANGHHHQRNGVPIPSQAHNGPDAATALAALNALAGSGTPRPHLVPSPRSTPSPTSDPRRWQRIDVTSGHLRGEPVAVPEGYAAQLGMRPGTLLSVTGPGDNAVVLVWRDRQPMFDSLQPVLMRLNARPGDSVYVTVDGYRLDAQLTS